jgi:hypothetical protein
MLPERGWAPTSQGQTEVELLIPDIPVLVRGHIDEIVERQDESHQRAVVDAKTMSDAGYKRYLKGGAYESYDWQLSVYMYALCLPGLIAAKNRNTGEMHVRYYEVAPVPLDAICAKIRHVEFMVLGGDWPDCVDSEKWICPFYVVHDEHLQGPFDKASVPENTEHQGLVEHYFQVMNDENALRAEREELRGRILGIMGDQKEIRTGTHVATRRVSTTTRLDNKEVRKLLKGDELARCQKESETVFLSVDAV